MILAIRTDSPEATVALAGKTGEIIDQEVWLAGRQLSNQLLAKIEQLLERNSSSWDDLKGVAAFEGPGSFTGLRIGLTVANTIAYSRSIPIAATGGDNWLAKAAEQMVGGRGQKQVVPHYGAQPNITRPKH